MSTAGVMKSYNRMLAARFLALVAALMRISGVAANIPPSFTTMTSPLFVQETVAPGSVITSLVAADRDNPSVTFSIVGDGAILAGGPLLAIRQTGNFSADVVLNGTLDAGITTQYTVIYALSDGVNPTITRSASLLVVSVINHRPRFTNLPNTVNVYDNVTIGEIIFQVRATDPDRGQWGSYMFSPLTSLTGLSIDPVSGNVNTTVKLDSTVNRYYSMTVMVQDGGGLNVTAILVINVLSSLGQVPVFFKAPYSAVVSENVTVGSKILQATAVSTGVDPPVPVTYSVVKGGLGMFNIEPSSGWIYVSGNVSREDPRVLLQNGVVDMIIQANQTLPNYVSTKATVSVTILDVNNQIPSFGYRRYNATVTDCSVTGSVVSVNPSIVVTDMDQGSNGSFVIYLMKDNLPFNALTVVPSYGQNQAGLSLAVADSSYIALRRQQTLTLQIVASEYLTSENYSSAAFIDLTILPVVQMAPTFARNFYTGSIKANDPWGTYVATVTVNNDTNFDVIRYSLVGPSANLFRIDNATGVITLDVNGDLSHFTLDPSSVGAIYLVVVADDTRNHSAATLLIVNIHEGPWFDPTVQYIGYIAENSYQFMVPVIVKADDWDSQPNNTFNYTVTGGLNSANFSIDTLSGRLSVVAPLDYEAIPFGNQGRLNLTVTAIDSVDPSLNTSAVVSVIVQDVNDFAPVFTQTSYVASVFSNSTFGNFITKVSAYDLDATSPNNRVTYYLLSGGRDNFVIDPQSGVISVSSVAQLVPSLYGSSYQLSVIAVDSGSPPLSASCQVLITIIDASNQAPSITSPTTKALMANVAEDTAIGTTFYTVMAMTASGMNQQIKYAFLNGSANGTDVTGQYVTDQNYLLGLFNIDALTGQVAVRNALSRTAVDKLAITVLVMDSATLLTTTATLIIDIIAPLRRLPVFVPVGSSVVSAQISSASAQIGDTVARAVAVDPDIVGTAVSYYINRDSPASYLFDITPTNAKTGLVTVAGRLYPGIGTVNLNIIAVSDRQSAVSNASTLMTIKVVDSGTQSSNGTNGGLFWSAYQQSAIVAENSTIGTYVCVVSATCTSTNCSVVYNVVAGDPLGRFVINSATGVMRTAGILDRKTTSQYQLTVTATENIAGSPTGRNLNAQVAVVVSAVDSPAVFDKPVYRAYILGNNPIDSVVLIVNATVPYYGQDSAIYYIQPQSGNGTHLFAIDPLSGAVTVASSLSGINGPVTFNVIALSRGFQSSSVGVVITVSGLLPMILSPPEGVLVLINESASFDQFILQVRATVSVNNVGYRLLPTSTDYGSFTMDSKTGIMKSLTLLSASVKSLYSVIVEAYNVNVTVYSTTRQISMKVRNAAEVAPKFSRELFPVPFVVQVTEGVIGYVTTVNAAKVLYDVCYYIVGGDTNYIKSFSLIKTTGVLSVTTPLVQSTTPLINLIVKATDDCWSGYYEMSSHQTFAWNPADTSLLLVQINVMISVKFSSSVFYAAVRKEAQIGLPLLPLANHITQLAPGAVVYSIIRPIWISEQPMSDNVTSLGVDPLIIGSVTGIVRTNIYFQPIWTGYFRFTVVVNNANSVLPGNTATVTVYLLEWYQRSVLVCLGTPDVIGVQLDDFISALSNFTSLWISADYVQSHVNNVSQSLKTNVFIHAFNTTTGELVNASLLITMLEANVSAFSHYGLQQILLADQVASYTLGSTSQTSSLTSLEKGLAIALAIVGGILLIALIALSVFFFLTCRRYDRKLRGANATAAAAQNNGFHHNSVDLIPPSHETHERVNPIWMERSRRDSHDPYHQFADTDTDSSRQSSEEPPTTSSTTNSMVVLDRRSPNGVPGNVASSGESLKSEPSPGPRTNGHSTATIPLDPSMGRLRAYTDADGNAKTIPNGNSQSTSGKTNFDSVAYNMHSTNV